MERTYEAICMCMHESNERISVDITFATNGRETEDNDAHGAFAGCGVGIVIVAHRACHIREKQCGDGIPKEGRHTFFSTYKHGFNDAETSERTQHTMEQRAEDRYRVCRRPCRHRHYHCCHCSSFLVISSSSSIDATTSVFTS